MASHVGVIEVAMGIDEPGHQHDFPEITRLGPASVMERSPGSDRGYAIGRDPDSAVGNRRADERQNEASAENHEQRLTSPLLPAGCVSSVKLLLCFAL